MKLIAIAIVFLCTAAQADPVVIVKDKITAPQTIITSTGTYIVIPNYTTGEVQSIVQVAKTKKKD